MGSLHRPSFSRTDACVTAVIGTLRPHLYGLASYDHTLNLGLQSSVKFRDFSRTPEYSCGLQGEPLQLVQSVDAV